MNRILKTLAWLPLLTTSLAVSASNWQCNVQISFGNNKPVNANIYLALQMNSIQFKIGDKNIEVSPLTISNGLYDYSKQETSDLSNERITSARFFRFDSHDGDLVYIDHDANHQMIIGTCRVQNLQKGPNTN